MKRSTLFDEVSKKSYYPRKLIKLNVRTVLGQYYPRSFKKCFIVIACTWIRCYVPKFFEYSNYTWSNQLFFIDLSFRFIVLSSADSCRYYIKIYLSSQRYTTTHQITILSLLWRLMNAIRFMTTVLKCVQI